MTNMIGTDGAGRFALPIGQDASPNRRFHATPQAGHVQVVDSFDGTSRTVPVSSLTFKHAAVSDDGATLAVLVDDPDGQHQTIRVGGPDGQLQVAAQGQDIRAIDLAADGSVVYSRYMDVCVVDGQGDRILARMPSPASRVQCLPDGRVLAATTAFVWGPPEVPVHYVVEPDGKFAPVGDPAVAETFGQPVLEILDQQYAKAFPEASPVQRRELAARFGYDTPAGRLQSPGRKWTAFSVTERIAPLAPGEAGVYLLPSGTGSLRRVPGLANLQNAFWNADEGRVALLDKDTPGHRALVLAETGSDVTRQLSVPWESMNQGDPLCYWSPDSRHLLIQGRGKEPLLFAYDWDKDLLYPLLAKGRFVHWQDGAAVINTGGQEHLVPMAPPGLENKGDFLFGEPAPKPAGEIAVGDDSVQIGSVRVPRRED